MGEPGIQRKGEDGKIKGDPRGQRAVDPVMDLCHGDGRAGIEEAFPVSDIVPKSAAFLLCRAGPGDDGHPLWTALELLLGLDGKADQDSEGRRCDSVRRDSRVWRLSGGHLQL